MLVMSDTTPLCGQNFSVIWGWDTCFIPGTQEAKAGRPCQFEAILVLIRGQSGLHSDILSQNKQTDHYSIYVLFCFLK